MSKPVNLNRFRKSKKREKESATAKTNAVKFGRCKDEKVVDDMHIKVQARYLDLHKREP
tara:strand:+ start:423 stop:599 length:177 start_codon:yes stop_codon:yes gene_type:complete